MTPDPRALAAWTFRNRLAAAHVAALPISHRGSAANPVRQVLGTHQADQRRVRELRREGEEVNTKTRVFYDTEFREDGRTIDLLSIGMVRETGESYYAVVSDADWEAVKKDKWLLENVWPGMPVQGLRREAFSTSAGISQRVEYAGVLDTRSALVKPKWVIANEVRDFLTDTPGLELWAWYAAYDHVALAQLWGRMIGLPEGVPMWTNDLRQEAERLGNPPLPEQEAGVHNALADAQHNLVRAQALGIVNLGDPA